MQINNKFKKFISCFFLSAIIICSCGCSSKMRSVIQGRPGTTIYDSFNNKVGYIGESGVGEIELNRRVRHDLLYARENATAPIIPIGLNYDKRHNEFRTTMTLITMIPTIWITAYCYANYRDNYDANDDLKLNKRQTTNQDLASIIDNSSNPIEEIRSLKPKQKKTSRSKSPKNNFSLLWINKEGEISELKSICIVTTTMNKTQSFAGSICFYQLDENTNPMIKIKGFLENGSELNYPIALIAPFRYDKNSNSYVAKDKVNNSDIKISPSDDGTAVLSFYMNGLNVKITFNPDSFKEDAFIPSKTDLFEMLFDF